jgi:hypothetical protein
MSEGLAGPLRTFGRTIAEMEAPELASRLTLIYLLLKPLEVWYLHTLMLVLVGAALLSPKLARTPTLWLLLTVLSAGQVLATWNWIDNHQYLLVYWCLAVFLSLKTSDPSRALALNGRLLIGAAFAFALIWKLFLTADFANGNLFRELLLTDPRFQRMSALFGLSQAMSFDNDLVLNQLAKGRIAVGTLVEPAGLVLVARLMTWWTILTETAIALAFFWPSRGRLANGLRDTTLLVFCWTAYSFGSVTGFGWLLLTMGIAQCDGGRKRTRWLYLLTFVLILVYARTPWSDLLTSLFGS